MLLPENYRSFFFSLSGHLGRVETSVISNGRMLKAFRCIVVFGL